MSKDMSKDTGGAGMKLTPWFKGSVMPIHKGVYQRIAPAGGVMYSRWHGQWVLGNTDLEVAARRTMFASPYQNLKWRGVAK